MRKRLLHVGLSVAALLTLTIVPLVADEEVPEVIEQTGGRSVNREMRELNHELREYKKQYKEQLKVRAAYEQLEESRREHPLTGPYPGDRSWSYDDPAIGPRPNHFAPARRSWKKSRWDDCEYPGDGPWSVAGYYGGGYHCDGNTTISDLWDKWNPVACWHRCRHGVNGCQHGSCECLHNCCWKAKYWGCCGVYPMDQSGGIDPRDTVYWSAQGWGMPMAVPLAPVVKYQYNYGWGLPASRLTRTPSYAAAWPRQFTSQSGNSAFHGQHPPMVYWPTDTTQLGYYGQRVPTWTPQPLPLH